MTQMYEKWRGMSRQKDRANLPSWQQQSFGLLLTAFLSFGKGQIDSAQKALIYSERP
jgi:hypothetical protein